MRNTQQRISQDYSKLVGVPYSEKDCFQLVQEFYSTILGIELKHYYDDTPTDSLEVKDLIYTNMGDFQKVDTPKFGDIVLMKMHGIERHVGIYIDRSRILHSLEHHGSVVDRMDRWKTAITGFYTVRDRNA